MGRANLYPSVACGLEGALLAATASAQRTDICTLLTPAGQVPRVRQVHVNGVLVGAGSLQAAAEEALRLVEQQGYSALKIKVTAARRTALSFLYYCYYHHYILYV